LRYRKKGVRIIENLNPLGELDYLIPDDKRIWIIKLEEEIAGELCRW
jgi:hypothetical protein